MVEQPNVLRTDRWSLALPEGWTAGRDGKLLQLRPRSPAAHVLVSDLNVTATEPFKLEDATAFLDSLLTSAKVEEAIKEAPLRLDPTHVAALGQGNAEQGFCSAAAHAWPGTVLLLTLFQADDDQVVRDEARSIFLSVHKELPRPKRSLLAKVFGR